MIEFVKANLLDIASMQNLVKKYIEDGIILDRSDDEVATNISFIYFSKEQRLEIIRIFSTSYSLFKIS